MPFFRVYQYLFFYGFSSLFGETFRTESQSYLPAEAKMTMGKHFHGFLDGETFA
jgi:hypothetical protein